MRRATVPPPSQAPRVTAFVPATTGNSSKLLHEGDGCNVYSAAGNAICSNAKGNGLEPSHTGDGICSNATGISLKPLHMSDSICSNAAAESFCSDAMGDGSCSISSAAGNGMCADATGDGSDLSQAFEESYSDAM